MTHAMHRRTRPAAGFRWFLLTLGLAIGLATTADPAHAGVEPPVQAPEPAILSKRGPVTDTGVAEIDRWVDRQRRSERTLRCWQEGQLIVERRVREGAEPHPRSVELADPQDRPMQLYDLRNAICMIE